MNERVIATLVAREILRRRCVVLVDNCAWTGHECDVLAVTHDFRIIDVEIKMTRADLKADAAKDKWWHRLYVPVGQPRNDQRRDWPPRIWKHYFAVPADMWDAHLLTFLPSPASGVITVANGSRGIAFAEVVRRAKPNPNAKRLDHAQVLDIARLANLRMWDAYAALERKP